MKDQKTISLMTNFKTKEAIWNQRIQDKTIHDLTCLFGDEEIMFIDKKDNKNTIMTISTTM